jgi:hypothetical protein
MFDISMNPSDGRFYMTLHRIVDEWSIEVMELVDDPSDTAGILKVAEICLDEWLKIYNQHIHS